MLLSNSANWRSSSAMLKKYASVLSVMIPIRFHFISFMRLNKVLKSLMENVRQERDLCTCVSGWGSL